MRALVLHASQGQDRGHYVLAAYEGDQWVARDNSQVHIAAAISQLNDVLPANFHLDISTTLVLCTRDANPVSPHTCQPSRMCELM